MHIPWLRTWCKHCGIHTTHDVGKAPSYTASAMFHVVCRLCKRGSYLHLKWWDPLTVKQKEQHQ